MIVPIYLRKPKSRYRLKLLYFPQIDDEPLRFPKANTINEQKV